MLVFAACGSSSPTPQSVSYTSGDTVITITENLDRAAYTPLSKDTYTITVKGELKSSGTVTVSSTTLTFTSGKGNTFKATLDTDGFRVTTEITLDDDAGTKVPVLGPMSPGDGKAVSGDPIAGTWKNVNALDGTPDTYDIPVGEGWLIAGGNRYIFQGWNADRGRFETYAIGTYNADTFTLEKLWTNGNLSADNVSAFVAAMNLSSASISYTVSGNTLKATSGSTTWTFSR
jgi:hypothetical protein